MDNKIEQSFLTSIHSLGKPTSKIGQSNIIVKYVVDDKTVTIPSTTNDESYDVSVTSNGGKV